jgi:signal transduction histidine kinase
MLLLTLLGCTGFTLLTWLAADVLGLVNLSPGQLALAAPVAGLVFLAAVYGAFRAGYALRRTVVPVGDLIEAANRVAEGDYSARVVERGPGEVSSLAHTFNSMVERLQTNEELRRRLLADVTHELRTPLTVIQGNLEGLLDGVYPVEESRLNALLEETWVMSRLINDLRTLSLVESGALQLQREPVNLEELARSAALAFQVQADRAGVVLLVEAEPGMHDIDADAERVRAVIENLIANALRFTPEGGKVLVRCVRESEELVSITVSDTGRGIPQEDLPHIFDRFYKSSDSRGMGLGLAIARSLVEAHGGEISAESQPGKGTTVRFSLPVEGRDGR